MYQHTIHVDPLAFHGAISVIAIIINHPCILSFCTCFHPISSLSHSPPSEALEGIPARNEDRARGALCNCAQCIPQWCSVSRTALFDCRVPLFVSSVSFGPSRVLTHSSNSHHTLSSVIDLHYAYRRYPLQSPYAKSSRRVRRRYSLRVPFYFILHFYCTI